MPLLSKVVYSKVCYSLCVADASNSYIVPILIPHQRHRLAAHMRKHHEGKNIKIEPSDQTSALSPQNTQDPSSISSNIRTSPSSSNEDGANQTNPSLTLPTTNITTQDQNGVSHDIMEISDNSENDEQARPPANTTGARAPHPHVPSSSARARAPAVPSARIAPVAPSAVASSKPTHQLKSSLPKMRRSDERFLLPEFRYNVMTSSSIYGSLKSYLVSMGETEDETFPWWRVIQDFVHLYFEHFDHEYPVIHPYALEYRHEKTSWMVLLAVVTVGSQYSAFGNASQFSASFGEILCHAITQNVSSSPGENPYLILIKSATSITRINNFVLCAKRIS